MKEENMKVLRLSRGIPGDLKKQASQIALASAADLTAFHLVEDDPFTSLAQAEVMTRLKYDFELLENPYSAEGITTKGEAIFVIDDSVSPPRLAGFSSYKPRAPSYTFATIVYIAVSETYRGKGVFRQIMTELLENYPGAAVDCPTGLVPLYEKFGFQVEESFGSHVLMQTGALNGKIVHLEYEELSAMPAFRSAKQLIVAKLGSNYTAAWHTFCHQNDRAVQAAEAFVQTKKPS
jgi:GNAT superfamily N-acetyltransferase